MSNETTQKRSLSVSLGAAFLMATSAIGPGFLTQTSQFTAKYLSSFAFVIVCVIIMDMIAQTNVWSIVGVSGLRGQEIANKVLPGLGYLLVVLVVLGGLAFNIGNVGGVSLGFNAMIGIPEKAGVIIGGVLAICIFLSKKANDIVGKVAQILGGAKRMVILAGALNGLILPISLCCMLLGCHKKSIVGEYKHPVWLQILGWCVVGVAGYLAVTALPNLAKLFA